MPPAGGALATASRLETAGSVQADDTGSRQLQIHGGHHRQRAHLGSELAGSVKSISTVGAHQVDCPEFVGRPDHPDGQPVSGGDLQLLGEGGLCLPSDPDCAPPCRSPRGPGRPCPVGRRAAATSSARRAVSTAASGRSAPSSTCAASASTPARAARSVSPSNCPAMLSCSWAISQRAVALAASASRIWTVARRCGSGKDRKSRSPISMACSKSPASAAISV